MKNKLWSVLLLVSSFAFAQTAPPQYGDPISLENAKKVLNAAEAFAIGKQWTVAIAIVDTGGNLVVFQKLTTHRSAPLI